ncbi:MAG: bifunctional 2-polyprenyl-6-hydroxyphenol methylase/3-demethylubiquinol 3-O-methyltransferase UbiG [Alphaproteobacteria bacterium]
MPASKTAKPETRTTLDAGDVARFEALAEAWWDEDGEFRPLHRLNPTRLAYIRDKLCGHFGRDGKSPHPLEGLRLLDIGCGGGLLSEPMRRLGADVTGLDAGGKNIEIAKLHAAQCGLDIDYRCGTIEALAETRARFDIVLNMEVVEHVADLALFIEACAHVLKPGGAMLTATLNRTPKSFAFAVVGAEYVLRWLPRGTHDWRQFVRPSELARELRANGLAIADLSGVSYNPLTGAFALSRDLDVNYMAFAVKSQA